MTHEKKIRERNEAPLTHAQRTGRRFVLLFGILAAVFEFLFLGVLESSAWFRSWLALNARWSAALLDLFGFSASSAGTNVTLGDTVIGIASGCDGIEAGALFALGVMTFPTSWSHRLVGCLAGVLALLALNVVRIASLVLCHSSLPRLFETLHVALWPIAILVAAMGLWLLWVLRAPLRTDVGRAT